jgi:crotonobetainyl-CoA:carnitine CoA-transferase CaiB-like acyl-CoA transferase
MSALSNLKILDLSRVLAGPWASQVLADLGAEVIKIENPEGGDDTRAWGPPFMADEAGSVTAESAYFLCTNRGKQSVCVDMKTPEGPINSVAEVFEEPQILARDMRVNVPHRDNAALELVGNPIKLSRTPVSYDQGPPVLGQHTDEVLARLARGEPYSSEIKSEGD